MDVNLSQLWNAGLPIWIVCLGGFVCLLVDALSPKSRLPVYATGAVVLAASVYVSFRQWFEGTNIKQDVLLLDPLTGFFVILILFISFFSLLNLYSYLKVGGAQSTGVSEAMPSAMVSLVLFSAVGMIFLFASDHLLVNFIGLETMSVAIYVLVGANRRDPRGNEASMKYYVMGSVASAILLYGIALLYGSFKTFRFAELATQAAVLNQPFIPRIAVGLILSGIFFKLALAPFQFWVPDVYEGAPAPVTGFMATGVKVATFALLVRLLTALPFIPAGVMVPVLTFVIVMTLLVGNLGALMQDNIKRLLAYSSISHAGYLLLGLLAGFKDGHFDPQASGAVLFYLIGYSLMTLGAFAVLSVMVRDNREVTQFADLTGLGYSRPVLALAFSLFMISLLGIPATVGFVGKYSVFSQAIKNGYVGLSVMAIVMSVVSAAYYLKPLVYMYFRGPADRVVVTDVPLPLMFSLVFCAFSVVFIGLNPSVYIQMAQMAAGVLK